jgi:hypothetical protein
VKRKIQIFYGRIRPTLNNGGLDDSIRTGVWADCARTTTFLSNIISIKAKDKCAYQLIFSRKSKLSTSLRIFGGMGVVITKDGVQGKLKNRSLTCMFVKYSVDHTNDGYWIFNLNTKRIMQTKDAVWLEKGYNDWRKNKAPSNDNDKDNDIRHCMENHITLNPKESSIEKSQVTQEENQKIVSLNS